MRCNAVCALNASIMLTCTHSSMIHTCIHTRINVLLLALYLLQSLCIFRVCVHSLIFQGRLKTLIHWGSYKFSASFPVPYCTTSTISYSAVTVNVSFGLFNKIYLID